MSASVAGFWVMRLVAQIAFFGFREPIAYAMSALFVAMAVPYALALAPAQPDQQQHRNGVASERER